MKKQRIIRNVLAVVLSVILAVVVPLSASAASGATPDYNSERGFRSITAYTGGGQGEGGGEESGTFAENGEQAAQNTELIVIKEVPTVDGGQATDWGGGNEGPDKLVDGYFGTKYGIGKYDRSDPEPWVEFHYEAPFTPVGYILRTAGDEEGRRNPVSWVIKARNNTTEEWTILDSKNNSGNEYLPMANNAETKFDIENNTAYQYYRFEATKRLNGPERQFQLAELQFYISGVSTLVYKNLTVTGGSAWGSVYGCGPENLVDNDKNTNSGYWLCNQAGDKSAPPGESGEYWWADFESTAPIEVQLYGLTASYIKGGNPKSWTIKAREKETDEWKVIETVTNESFPNQDSPTEWFVLDTPGTYQYFRLLISESTNDSRLLLREIELAYHYFPSGIRGDHGVGNHYPESYDSLVDGDPDTKWYCGPGAKSVPEGETGSFYWMDFHLDKLIEAEGYSLTTGYDNTLYPGRNPVSWILKAKGRADDHWVVIDTVNNDTTLTDEDKKTFNFNLDTPGTYRYFRLLISESRGSDGIQLSELKIKAGSGSGSGGSVETWEKKITGLGTGAIANPADGNLGWSYVYYGKYNGNPVKYRVLDKNSHDFGVENGSLFLDCDSILFRAAFYSGQPVTDWRDSELRSRLNGDAFLDKDGVFTGMEKDAIGESTKASKADGDGSYGASDIFSPWRLTGYSSLMWWRRTGLRMVIPALYQTEACIKKT